MKNIVFFARVFCISLLVCLLYTPKGFAQQTPTQQPRDDLSIKINELLNKSETIVRVFQQISNQLVNENVSGADKVVNAVDQAFERLNKVRDMVGMLSDKLNHNAMSLIKTKPESITIGGSGIWNTSWTIPFPSIVREDFNLDPDFPKLKNYLLKFLDFADQPLSYSLELVQEMQDTLTFSLARVNTTTDYSKSLILTPGFEEAEYLYPERIRNWLSQPSVIVTALLLQKLMTIIKEKLDAYLSQNLTVLGEGGNLKILLSVVNVVKHITDAFQTIVQNCKDNIIKSEIRATYKRVGHNHNDIASVQESLDYHLADFQDWKELSIRTRIEINLAGHGTHPHPIAIFQLPQEFGGYLELARDIVQSTINKMLAAGENIYQAQTFHTRGNDEFAANHYKKAYDWYSKSYDEATK